MLKLIFLAGVALVALGIIGLNVRIEGAALLLVAGAVVIGAGAIVGISAGGKEVRKRAGF
jgi:hypothetical protein